LSDRSKGIYAASDPIEWLTFVAFAVSFFVWLISTNAIRQRIEVQFIRSRFSSPQLGVIRTADQSDGDFGSIRMGCDFSPQIWVRDFQANHLSSQTVEYSKSIRNFDVLFNPYGERYLESDISNMRSLKEIKEFVKNGGLFVTIGGLPFFYMYDPKTNIEGLTGPLLEIHGGGMSTSPFGGVTGAYRPSIILEPTTYPDASSLSDTWIFRNLGVRTTLGSATIRPIQLVHEKFDDLLQSITSVQEFRSIDRCESDENELIPILKSEYQYAPTQRIHECYPVAVLRYGLGYFLFCGFVVNDEAHKTLVEKSISKICVILAERGRLERP
jgi:hypothetical protein